MVVQVTICYDSNRSSDLLQEHVERAHPKPESEDKHNGQENEQHGVR